MNSQIAKRFSLFISLVFLAIPQSAFSETYELFQILRADTPGAPGNDGELFNPYVAAPVIEGDYVVFRTRANEAFQPFSTIWSYNIQTKEFKRLVDRTMDVPGGTGKFTEFSGSGLGGPVLKDGFVVFAANDSGTNLIPSGGGFLTGIPAGIFSIPVGGGTITRIAHYSMPVPGESTNYFTFGQNSSLYGNFGSALGKVVFHGTYGGGPIGGEGVYLSDVDGTSPVIVANRELPWNPEVLENDQFQNFNFPSTNGTTVAFWGGTVNGASGLFTAPIPPTPGSYSRLVGPSTVLPGVVNNFDTAVLQNSIQIDGDNIAFRGRKSFNGEKGIYLVNKSGGSLTKVVSTADSLDGVPDVNTFCDLSYGMDNGQVFFKALDSNGNLQGYYIWSGGTISKVFSIVPQLTTVLGLLAYDLSELQPQSISDGRVVFAVRALGAPYHVLVLGIPSSQVSDVALSLISSPASAKIGDTVNFVFKVANNGPGVASGLSLDIDSANFSVTGLAGSATRTSSRARTSHLLPNINSGQSQTIGVTGVVNAEGTVGIDFEIKSASFDTVQSNSELHVDLTVGAKFTPLDSLRQLSAQARSQLVTAKKEIPKGKKLTAKQKKLKAKITAARKALDALVAQLVSLSQTSGPSIAQTETSFTSKNISALKKAIKSGKSTKLNAKAHTKQWKAADKLLLNLVS